MESGRLNDTTRIRWEGEIMLVGENVEFESGVIYDFAWLVS